MSLMHAWARRDGNTLGPRYELLTLEVVPLPVNFYSFSNGSTGWYSFIETCQRSTHTASCSKKSRLEVAPTVRDFLCSSSILHRERHWNNWVVLDGRRDNAGDVPGNSEFAVERRADQALVSFDDCSDDP